MSFFDNTKIVGWAFTIIGILMIVSAFLQIVDAVGMEGGIGENIGYLIAAIGAIIAAVIYFKFGNSVRVGAISNKIDILATFVKVVGATTVVTGIFSAVGGIISSIGFWDSIVAIVLGLIIIWIGGKIDDGKTTGFDKILWIVLLLIFLVLFITSLLAIGGGFMQIISSICSVIVYLFMAVFLFDGDVKKKMGM